MANVNYTEIFRLSTVLLRAIPPQPKTLALSDVHASFETNITRVGTLASLPAFLTNAAYIVQELECRIRFNLTGALDSKMRLPYNDRRAESIRLIQANPTRMIPYFAEGEPSENDAVIAAMNVDHFIATNEHEYTLAAMTALLSALILGGYTVLESLTTDLWVVAVNNRPASLAMNVFRVFENKDKDQKRNNSRAQSPATIPLEMLKEYNFNVSERMGDILLDRERVDFRCIQNAKQAYFETFLTPEDTKSHRPSNTLMQMFDAAMPALKVLEELRNLIVHRGGKIDQKFLDNIKPYPNEFNSLPLHSQIPIDGSIVAKYVEPAIEFSVKLLSFVDDWLVKYPT